MTDRSDLHVSRPLRPPGGAAAGAAGGAKSALAVGPATAALMPGGAWPEELQELFLRNAALPRAGGGQAGASEWREGGREGTEGSDWVVVVGFLAQGRLRAEERDGTA